MNKVKTAEEFKKLSAGKFTVVKFGAEWCGPCRAMKPILEELSGEKGTEATFIDVDTDVYELEDVVKDFGVRGIPAFIFMKDGIEVSRVIGSIPKNKLSKKIDELIK